MGLRGPLPKNHNQPKPEVISDTAPPATLDILARVEWKRLIDELASLGRICNLDRSLLIVHCQAVSDYTKYCSIIQEKGETYETASGQIKFRPEVMGRNQAAQFLVKTASELLFTPNSRNRSNVPTKAKADSPSLSEILSGKKKK